MAPHLTHPHIHEGLPDLTPGPPVLRAQQQVQPHWPAAVTELPACSRHAADFNGFWGKITISALTPSLGALPPRASHTWPSTLFHLTPSRILLAASSTKELPRKELNVLNLTSSQRNRKANFVFRHVRARQQGPLLRSEARQASKLSPDDDCVSGLNGISFKENLNNLS